MTTPRAAEIHAPSFNRAGNAVKRVHFKPFAVSVSFKTSLSHELVANLPRSLGLIDVDAELHARLNEQVPTGRQLDEA